ncbi:hypothetical protein CTI12_AA461250 [Artemisia annua]|uniref:Uncharacterized protein n=1 Tax=Artemisia annua TaxID=35608 RepID=A0A2U1LSB1_ARTAN|nr:hypothetical protein CTI12_AA461250 [Artemisia annua]
MLCLKRVVEKPKNDGFQEPPRQNSRGINVGSKFQFKPKKQVYQAISKKNAASLSGTKKNFEVDTSSSIVASKKVDNPVNEDCDSEVFELILESWQSLNKKQKDVVCLSLYYAINWIRELIWNYWLEGMGLELLCCGAVFLGPNGFGAVFLGSDLEMGLEVVMLWLILPGLERKNRPNKRTITSRKSIIVGYVRNLGIKLRIVATRKNMETEILEEIPTKQTMWNLKKNLLV